MDSLLAYILAFVILIPAVIAVIRFRYVLPSFRPFLWFIWVGLISECLNVLLPVFTGSNALNSNIYVLVEGLLLLVIFYHWSFQTKPNRNWYLAGAVLFIIIWTVDNLYLHSPNRFNSIYRIIYSLVIVFLAVNQMNREIFHERGAIFRNATFLICIAFVFYYCYRVIFEVFYLYNFGLGRNFYLNLYTILMLINFMSNLVYTLAVIWIPTKLRFTLPY